PDQRFYYRVNDPLSENNIAMKTSSKSNNQNILARQSKRVRQKFNKIIGDTQNDSDS
ncbi:MAG: hypothetical protein MHPSP_000677, partial [Paramarteilia canceri]